MNMHNITNDSNVSSPSIQSVSFLKNYEVPQDLKDYYHAYQKLLMCMQGMDMRVDNYDFSTVNKDEILRAELFVAYQNEVSKAHAKNLSDKSKNIVRETIEYLQQCIVHEVFKLNVKKDVIGNTFKELTKKTVSKRVTYNVHNKKNVDYKPLQVTEL